MEFSILGGGVDQIFFLENSKDYCNNCLNSDLNWWWGTDGLTFDTGALNEYIFHIHIDKYFL